MLPAFASPVDWSDETLTLMLTEADAETSNRCWGEFRLEDDRCLKKRGMYNFAGHLLSSFYGSSANDPTAVEASARLNIASKSIGDESVSYRITAMEKTTDDYLSTTIYGVTFMRLRLKAAQHHPMIV